MKESTRKFTARICIIAATMMWGSMFVVSKVAMETVPVYFMTASRYTAASILLAVICRKRLKGNFVRSARPGLILGLMLVAGSLLQMAGLKYSTPGKTAFLTVIYCVLVPFVYWIMYKKRPTAWNAAAAVICLAGVGFISLGDDLSIASGDLMVLGGGIIFALHIVMLSVFVMEYDPVILTMMQFIVGGAVSWILHFATQSGPITFLPSDIISLIYIAIFPTCIAMLLQSFAQRHIEPSAAAIMLCLESVFGVLFSVIFYNETLTPRIITGFVLIFVSIVISETKLSFLRPGPAGTDQSGE